MRRLSDDPTAAAAGITRADRAQHVAATDGVSATDASAEARGADAAAPTGASDPVHAVAAALASGAVDAAGAAEGLIAAVFAGGIPAGVSPTAWAAVQAEVTALLAGDPALADLLAPT